MSSAPANCGSWRPNAGSGDGFCQTQQSVERLEAIPSDPRLRIERGTRPYRRARGKIAQTQRVPARIEVAKRAETKPAEGARAPRGSDIARAVSPSGKADKDSLEKDPWSRQKVPPLYPR